MLKGKLYLIIWVVNLGMQSEGNAPKNGKPAVGFSFTTMLQHTGRFWIRISEQRTFWQHYSIPHTFPTCLQLIFTCSLYWTHHQRDRSFVMVLTLRVRRKSWKVFPKWLPGMLPTPLYSCWQKFSSCTRGLFWRKCRLNDCTFCISQK